MKIGQTQQLSSDNYGTYNSVFIATVDFRKFKDPKFYTMWMNKYHPAVYFGAWGTDATDNDIEMNVYVPLDRANEKWLENNKDCQYVHAIKSHGGRVKGLPVGISDKKLAKWLEVSKPYLTSHIE